MCSSWKWDGEWGCVSLPFIGFKMSNLHHPWPPSNLAHVHNLSTCKKNPQSRCIVSTVTISHLKIRLKLNRSSHRYPSLHFHIAYVSARPHGSTPYKLVTVDCLCQIIYHVIISMNFLHIHSSFFHFLTNEVILNSYMLFIWMKCWIPCKIQGSLVVTK